MVCLRFPFPRVTATPFIPKFDGNTAGTREFRGPTGQQLLVNFQALPILV